LIPFDWSTDLATSILELKRLRGYMVQYRKNLMVFSRVVSQILYREPGSYLAPRMSRIDFFAFERDPRALFLAFLIRSMQHKLTGPLRTALKGAENMATDNLLAFYLVSFGVYCRSVLQSMLVKQFNLKPVLEIIDAETEERTKKVVRAVTKSFLSQLSPAKRTEVQSLFNGFAAAAKERFNKIMQQP
jgi:hypothetical protein